MTRCFALFVTPTAAVVNAVLDLRQPHCASTAELLGELWQIHQVRRGLNGPSYGHGFRAVVGKLLRGELANKSRVPLKIPDSGPEKRRMLQ